MTDPEFPFDEPIHVPAASPNGPGYDAVVERSRAAMKAARSVLPSTTVIDTVADLVAITAALPPEMPVVVDEIVRAVPTPDPCRPRTIVSTVDIATVLHHPRNPLHTASGEQYGELVPGLELGLLAVLDPDPDTPDMPMPVNRSGFPAHHPVYRVSEAFEEGRADTGMSSAADVAAGLADELESHLEDSLPGGRIPPEVAATLQQLRSAASALRSHAPAVQNLIIG